MYSLVSASVLAIDLSRHPSGAAVADVVDGVLALTVEDLHALAAAASPTAGPARARVLAAGADAPRMSRLMRGVAGTVADGLPSPAVSNTLEQALSETLLGGLADLLALLRREAPLNDPGAPAAGVQAALDAVAAAWAGRHAELADLALLRAPWAAALSPLPPALPERPWTPALRELLDSVSRLDGAGWARVARAHAARRTAVWWSTTMHQACRAAYDEGRLTDVARAQLAAARALRLSAGSTGVDAHAVAMVVTAAVQAVCTRDLLSGDCAAALLRPWEEATSRP